jgi:YHS domain-containing protein
MMRQVCKQILTIAAWLVFLAGAHAQSVVTTIVSDPLTGVAIDGFDPVSYFIDPEPRPGRPDFVYEWGGVPWYFVSAANRDVFKRNPAFYAPQFGGHCVTSLSRGFLSDGKPRLYVVEALKLYMFYSTANRDAFLMSKSAAVAQATANWAKLSVDLEGPAQPAPATTAQDPGTSGQDAAPPVEPAH